MHRLRTKEEWVTLFKKHFKFVGGEIADEFLMNTDYLSDACAGDYEVYREVLKHKPKWIEAAPADFMWERRF